MNPHCREGVQAWAEAYARMATAAIESVDPPFEEDDETICIPECDGLRPDCRCKDNLARPGCEESHE